MVLIREQLKGYCGI